mmetsp:Transcript_47930/g.95352  ORF Transcript_47930/g.95352 Transcript_47930/m.95352 type:complete len:260 (+) Transcript_47930:33-812(+)
MPRVVWVLSVIVALIADVWVAAPQCTTKTLAEDIADVALVGDASAEPSIPAVGLTLLSIRKESSEAWQQTQGHAVSDAGGITHHTQIGSSANIVMRSATVNDTGNRANATFSGVQGQQTKGRVSENNDALNARGHDGAKHLCLQARLTINSASLSTDWYWLGTSDPYAKCYYKTQQQQETSFLTETLVDTYEPRWNHSSLVLLCNKTAPLHFEVYDDDYLLPSKLLGAAELHPFEFWDKGFNGSLPLGLGAMLWITVEV